MACRRFGHVGQPLPGAPRTEQLRHGTLAASAASNRRQGQQTALGVAQTRQVLDVVKRLRDTGHAVVYISHNLGEIFEVSDRITVLRHGANVAIYEAADTYPDEIVVAMTVGNEMIVGKERATNNVN